MTIEPLRVNVAELYAHLNLVKHFVAPRDLVPIYKHVLFHDDTIRAYLGDAGVVAYTSWRVPKPFTIPAARLVNVVQSLFEQKIEKVSITFKPKGDGGHVVLRGDRSTATFHSMAPQEFPLITPPAKLKTRTEVTSDFWLAVAAVEFAVAVDEAKPSLRGVYWGADRLMATDAYGVARTPFASAPPGGSVLLPDYLLNRFAAHRSSVDAIGRDQNMLWVFLESAAIFGALLEAEFPMEGATRVFVEAKARLKAAPTWCDVTVDDAALGRLQWFVDEQSPRVRVQVDSKAIIVTATHDHMIEEVMPAKVSGPVGGDFTVKLRAFREALARAPRFCTSPNAPVYFMSTDASRPQVQYVMQTYAPTAPQ